jgi:hypothetical protein
MIRPATPEEKQHMINLIQEMRNILAGLHNIKKEDRNGVVQRLREIEKEMKAFRKDHPYD